MAKQITKQIVSFLAWIAFIIFFMLVIAPIFDNLPVIRPVIDFIEEENIDATALYYTEIEEFFDSDIYMNNAMRFNPKKD